MAVPHADRRHRAHRPRQRGPRPPARRRTDRCLWSPPAQTIGALGGFELTTERQYRDGSPYALILATCAPIDGVPITLIESDNPAPGIVVRVDNVLRALNRRLPTNATNLEHLITELERDHEQVGQPFKHRGALHAAVRSPQPSTNR